MNGDHRSADGRRPPRNRGRPSDRCPFCGESIADGGPGFVEHIESADDCAVAFARWREGVTCDVEGEWVA